MCPALSKTTPEDINRCTASSAAPSNRLARTRREASTVTTERDTEQTSLLNPFSSEYKLLSPAEVLSAKKTARKHDRMITVAVGKRVFSILVRVQTLLLRG